MTLDREKDHHIQNLALLGQLVGGIAHDFNNLVTAMLFNLETARTSPPESVPSHRAFRNLHELMLGASTTARQLLTFARQRTQNSRPLEANSELQRSLGVLDRLMGDGIDLFFIGNSEPMWMLADPTMLDQTVLNLCLNARDAMPQGGVVTVQVMAFDHTASARRSPEASPGPYVEIRFSDTGTGIAPEHLDRVFEPFFTTKAGGGTGLGLASVSAGARQHGGWVEVESTMGQGTMFSVFLPRLSAMEEPTRLQGHR